jgi:biopolymer transport protein ExbD
MRTKRNRTGGDVEEINLNLMPFMNLMTLLIPFLLLSASFVTIAVIDSSLPAIGAPQPKDKEDEEDKEPPLNLQIGITDEGFTVSGSSPILGCSDAGKTDGGNVCKQIPLTDNAEYCEESQCGGVTGSGCRPDPACHDFKELRDVVQRLKNPRWEGGSIVTDYPDEGNVIIAPNKSIKYSVLVGVMDATRNMEAPTGGELTPVGSGFSKATSSECYPNVCLFPYVVIAGGVK